MNAAKIRLSQKEMELVINAELILTKNAIQQKTNQLLANLQAEQQQYLQSCKGTIPNELVQSTPKISRGENYHGLPYLVLDFPRIFTHSTICSIRTIFWWGNFFSCTLHLSGLHKKINEEKILAAFELLQQLKFYCCINEDEWEHHFETNNYLYLAAIQKNTFGDIIRNKSFIKLANKIPLEQWDDAEEILLNSFRHLVTILAD